MVDRVRLLFSSRGSLSRIERVFLHVIAWTIVLVPLMIVGAAWKPWPVLSLLIPVAMLAGATVGPYFAVVLGLPPSRTITDVTIAQTVSLTGRGDDAVTEVVVRVNGSINGSATLRFMDGSQTMVDGAVDRSWKLDNYSRQVS